MYTRNYYNDGASLPEDYDGVALLGQRSAEPEEKSEDTPVFKNSCDNEKVKPPLFKNDSFLGGLFGNLHLGLPSLDKIGYEEILIIAVAAFLFFSDGGDKECAIILILLLLIN